MKSHDINLSNLSRFLISCIILTIAVDTAMGFSLIGTITTTGASCCTFVQRISDTISSDRRSCTSGSANQRNFLTMKISKGKSKQSKSNSLFATNQMRKRLAGKPGSKHFMDPNKVFIGNLPFSATVSDIEEFLRLNLGGLHNVESIKIISDWKTGQSKGYGFVQFMEPIYATCAMETIKGKKLMGRVIRLDQGKRKDDDEKRILFVKKRERSDSGVQNTDTEEGVIDAALDEVEGIEGYIRNDEDNNDETVLRTFSMGDFDNQDDTLLFGEEMEDDEDSDDDNSDEEVDGWFEEFYGGSRWEELSEEEMKNMNRSQRREAQRMKPKKKLPHKGFGDYIPKTPPPEI